MDEYNPGLPHEAKPPVIDPEEVKRFYALMPKNKHKFYPVVKPTKVRTIPKVRPLPDYSYGYSMALSLHNAIF